MSRSICELACDVQASGLCVPDWVGVHAADPDLYDYLRRTENRQQAWSKLCREIENQRHFLFDELPNARTVSRGLWTDPAAALADYSRRIGQPELPRKVQQLWN
jgi:hypothetical protein